MTPQQLIALCQAENALSFIIAEAPDLEPVYPPDGSPIQSYEDWAYASAHWNDAQTARPALEAVWAVLLSLYVGA